MNKFSRYLYEKEYYNYDDIAALVELKKHFRYSFKSHYMKDKRANYFEIPAAFDIETSSFYDVCGDKTAIMYIWMFGIFGRVFVGRTWEEFLRFYDLIIDVFNISLDYRLCVYVHNLDFEFQFFRKYLTWHDVFAVGDTIFSSDRGKPLTATTVDGLEFRCSYKLAGLSLEKVGENLLTYTGIYKKTGSLDYTKVRHSKTPLTSREMEYCINDVKVLLAYIQESITRNGSITKIPLTSTGYTRRHCRDKCFFEGEKTHKKSKKRLKYQDFIAGLKLTLDEYIQLKDAFQGGFTHGNPLYMDDILEGISSLDFTSSYPTVMIAEKFPVGSAEDVEIKSMDDLEKNLKLYCCLFDIEITGLESKYIYEYYISSSKCKRLVNAKIFNGRVKSADILTTTITDVDYEIIRTMYYCKSIKVTNFRRYKKGYLPTDLVKAILELYKLKTELKGIPGKEEEYMYYKALLNSCYGMCVTSILRNEPKYENDHWLTSEEKAADRDDIKTIQDYNNDKNRFLFYPWGVWVTAYARRNLYTAIIECGLDYVYSDTDSVKIFNYKKHKRYFDLYNRKIIGQLKDALDYHGIPYDYILPKTKKGVTKPLGVWEYEGTYKYFKTLGAKRYMTYKDQLSITVSGVNKRYVLPWLLSTGNHPGYYITDDKIRDCFTRFTNDLYIPAGYTGKSIHAYIDDPREGVVRDYLGTCCKYSQKSGIHLEQSDYSLSLSQQFLDFVLQVRTL